MGDAMKKLLALLLILVPFNVKAYCDASAIVDLKEQASNLSISYDYRIVDNKAYFDVTITNITNEIYLEDDNGRVIRYEDTNNGEIILADYTAQKIKFQAYAVDEECYDLALVTKYVNFPVYNYRYSDPLCNGIEEYELCQKWNAPSVSDDEFKEKVELYRKKIENDKTESTYQTDKSFLTKISTLFISYYLVVIPVIICICLYLFYKNKKSEIL